jgi:DNA (cytosine-5)-methyltransferase 1
VNVLSLFSGIDGLGLGLERAGMTVVGQVEIDEFCRRVLAKHWPEVPRYDDVRTCVEWWRSERRPPVDLVAGGFPCQGHSVAGQQLGTTDERWGWPWFRAVAEALEPPLVLIENVPNLVRTGLLDVLQDLAGLGFDAWWNRVPAAALGAPHLRWRLFVIAAHPERVELRHEPGWGGWPGWTDQTVVGHDGTTWALADPECVDGGEGWPGRSALSGDPGNVEQSSGLGDRALGGRTWAAEPAVPRVVDGVLNGMDRRRSLGNAVVPQVSEYVGRLIMAATPGALLPTTDHARENQ